MPGCSEHIATTQACDGMHAQAEASGAARLPYEIYANIVHDISATLRQLKGTASAG